MRVIQAGHLLVPSLWIESNDVTVVEFCNQRQRVAHGWKEDVAAWFVGLWLQADLEIVTLVLDVGSNGIQALLVAIQRCIKVLGGIVFCAFAAAPHDEGLGAQFGGQINVLQDLAQPEASDRTIVV